MKKLLTISFLLISLSLSANHVDLTPTGIPSITHFYYCNTVDSIIVHSPTPGIANWINPYFPDVNADSLIITPANQGWWNVTPAGMGQFTIYVNFVSISPVQPWTMIDSSKCTENNIVLNAQLVTQPDFTYLWSTAATTQTITVNTPNTYIVTITGACATVMDTMTVNNFPVPTPNLGPDVVSCDGNTVTLNPGAFVTYLWNNAAASQTIGVTTTGTSTVTVTDVNGCHASDTINVSFDVNDGELIKLVTIDTITGNNMVTWDATGLTDVTVNIYREVSTNVYAIVGSAPYADGLWIDTVSSVPQTWRYKITTVDTCGNESALSPYHQTISSATVPTVPSGWKVIWTEYLIEGGKQLVVNNYHVLAVDGLGGSWNPTAIASVTGYVTSYNLPNTTDSMFLVGAELAGKTVGNDWGLSNVVNNPLIIGIADITENKFNFAIYPNPSNGIFTVKGNGSISIYDVIGSLILTDNINGTAAFNLNTGIYMVKVTNQNATITERIIIQ